VCVSTQQLDVRPCQYIYLLGRLYRWASPIAGRWSVIDEPTPNTRKWCKGCIRDMFIAALYRYILDAPPLFFSRRMRRKKTQRRRSTLCPIKRATDLIINENHHHLFTIYMCPYILCNRSKRARFDVIYLSLSSGKKRKIFEILLDT
jgi:hypothetical protein